MDADDNFLHQQSVLEGLSSTRLDETHTNSRINTTRLDACMETILKDVYPNEYKIEEILEIAIKSICNKYQPIDFLETNPHLILKSYLSDESSLEKKLNTDDFELFDNRHTAEFIQTVQDEKEYIELNNRDDIIKQKKGIALEAYKEKYKNFYEEEVRCKKEEQNFHREKRVQEFTKNALLYIYGKIKKKQKVGILMLINRERNKLNKQKEVLLYEKKLASGFKFSILKKIRKVLLNKRLRQVEAKLQREECLYNFIYQCELSRIELDLKLIDNICFMKTKEEELKIAIDKSTNSAFIHTMINEDNKKEEYLESLEEEIKYKKGELIEYVKEVSEFVDKEIKELKEEIESKIRNAINAKKRELLYKKKRQRAKLFKPLLAGIPRKQPHNVFR